jgi:hypothetical protein
VVASAGEIGGQYCENCYVGKIVADDVAISAISEGMRGYALDPNNAEALWKKSEELHRDWKDTVALIDVRDLLALVGRVNIVENGSCHRMPDPYGLRLCFADQESGRHLRSTWTAREHL